MREKNYFPLFFVRDSSDVCVGVVSYNHVSGTAVVTRNKIMTLQD